MSGKLDLSNLPPEVRQKVEAGLARLPPDVRRQWEEHGSPMLDKLVAGLARKQAKAAPRRGPPPVPASLPKLFSAMGATRTSPPPAPNAPRPAASHARELPSPPHLNPRSTPHHHYNDTIAPGDRPGVLQRWLLALAIAGVLAWLFF